MSCNLLAAGAAAAAAAAAWCLLAAEGFAGMDGWTDSLVLSSSSSSSSAGESLSAAYCSFEEGFKFKSGIESFFFFFYLSLLFVPSSFSVYLFVSLEKSLE